MNKEEAYKLGFDCGKNGANTTNANFKIFSQPEFTEAWTKGRDDALGRNKDE